MPAACYFGYMTIISLGFFALTGTIGEPARAAPEAHGLGHEQRQEGAGATAAAGLLPVLSGSAG